MSIWIIPSAQAASDPTGPASGDLSGSYPNPTVARLQGKPVNNTAPGSNQILLWNGAQWFPTDLRQLFSGSGIISFNAGSHLECKSTNGAPTVAALPSGFTASVIAGSTDIAGAITLQTTSTSSAAGAALATVTFASAFTNIPFVVVTRLLGTYSSATSSPGSGANARNVTTTGFSIVLDAATPASAVLFAFSYIAIGYY